MRLMLRRTKPKLMSIRAAAKRLGLPEQRVRTAMQQGMLDIGFVTKAKGGRRVYTIYEHKVEKYLGGEAV